MHNLPARALHDPVLCLAPELFRSLIRGSRQSKWRLVYEHNDVSSYVFSGPALLGCDDLRVLQGIVALANRAKRVIRDNSSKEAKKLRTGLALVGAAKGNVVLIVDTSLAALARTAGYATRGGTMACHLRESLNRLALVQVEERQEGRLAGWRMIAWDNEGLGHNKIRIALNPRLGLSARGFARFVQIDMDEARQLDGDIARLLHQRLCGWINASQRKPLLRDSLMIYPGWERVQKGATVRQRQARLAAALDELRAIGWRIEEEGKGKFWVERPAVPEQSVSNGISVKRDHRDVTAAAA